MELEVESRVLPKSENREYQNWKRNCETRSKTEST